jgi:aminopeptidase N
MKNLITNFHHLIISSSHHLIRLLLSAFRFPPSTFSILLFCLLPSSLLAQTKADTLHVSHYDINLEIRNLAQEEIKGYTDLYITSKIAPLTNINLDLFALTVDSIKKGAQMLTYLHQGHNLNVTLPFSSVGQNEILRVYYRGKPKKEAFGGFFFAGDTAAYNMGVGMSYVPHSIGRFWYPCIDDFNDKSTYTFNITTDLDKKAVCGGMLADSANLGDAMRWRWELTDPIPTYLASVAVGKYQVYQDTVHSISGAILPIEIYTHPNRIQNVPGTFINLKSFIHTFEKRWGACRWQRVGYVAVPYSGGAMEHATNIAFPQSHINGNVTITNQELISHELAHSWFGNLLTCSTSQNMWINEGFARYGEYLCHEMLDPTLQKYQTEIRVLHFRVLRSDKGLFALDNLPPNETYNTSIVYDKGGLTAYRLRYYMGDDLYFSSITQLLNNNQYGNMDSEEFFNRLSQISGLDLSDFYLAWVHQPGFLNFNIDSVKLKNNNVYEVALKQKLYLSNYFAEKNLVDVDFVSASGERYLAEKIRFSGAQEIVEIPLPFEPVFWAIDPNGKLGDACFKYTQLLDKAGNTNLSDANIRIQVIDFTDESILRVEHHLVAPTPSPQTQHYIVKISEKRYWRIGFLKYNPMQATYTFSYNNKTYDGELLQGYTKEDLHLLYRKDASHDWQIIPATVSGTNESGTLVINSILPGDYVFAICRGVNVSEWENDVVVYPNPTEGEFRIRNYESGMVSVEIYDVMGKMQQAECGRRKAEGEVVVDISHLAEGIYFMQIKTDKGIITKRIVKHKP